MDQLHTSLSDQHIPALDGGRGIAILLVLLFHAWRAPLTSLGWAGVDLFFVLSGFLITGILLDQRGTPHRARNFYVRRALRILPLYYGVLIAVFVVRPLLHLAMRPDDGYLTHERVWYWTYLCAWRMAFNHPPSYTFLTHFWSLSIEEQFYLVWPWIVWRVSKRQLAFIAVALCVIALALRCYFALDTLYIEAAYMLPVCRMDALAIGALMAIVVRGPTIKRAVANGPYGLPACIVLGVIFTIIVAAIAHTANYTNPLMSTVGYSVIDWTAAAFVFMAALRPIRWLAAAPLRWLGKYSYGLYVIHPFVNWWAVRHAPVLERSPVVYTAGVLTLSLACAVASYHLYERPFLRLKNRFTLAGHGALVRHRGLVHAEVRAVE